MTTLALGMAVCAVHSSQLVAPLPATRLTRARSSAIDMLLIAPPKKCGP